MRHLSTGQDGQADTAASCWWSEPVTKRDKVTSWLRDTDLGVGLTHGLVQGLVGVDGLLQHTDVIADLSHLTVAWPASHTLDVLKMVEMILTKCFLGNVESFTFSAFWWKRTDSDRTVLLSSRPAAKFFQVLSRRDATFLKNEKHLKIKSSNCSGMSSSSPDVTSCVVTSLD